MGKISMYENTYIKINIKIDNFDIYVNYIQKATRNDSYTLLSNSIYLRYRKNSENEAH